MNERRSSNSAFALPLVGGILAGLCLAAPPAFALPTTLTVQAAGTVVGQPESVSFSGPVKIRVVPAFDPATPPGVVVFYDARGLTGKGLTTGATYVNTGHANLTRLLAATDTIKTTFAFYQNVPGGYLKARTGLATIRFTFDSTTGVPTSTAITIGNLQ